MKSLITLLALAALSGCTTINTDKISELAEAMNELSALNVQEFNYNGFYTVWTADIVSDGDGWETVTYTGQGKAPGAPSAKLVYKRFDRSWIAPKEPEPMKVLIVEPNGS